MEQKEARFNIRHLARIVVETTTPIAVGSGEKDIMTDSRVVKDVNGLPYIPATSVAGVLRHAMGESDKENKSIQWGYQLKKEGAGSRIIFTNANLIDEEGSVVDGVLTSKSEFLAKFETLPIRQHARIGHRGHTENYGKFDEEVVFKGTRFCFEIEMLANDNDTGDEYFENLLKTIHQENLRMGGGTRSGFGELEVKECKSCTLNLQQPNQLEAYINKPSSLSDTTFWNSIKVCNYKQESKNDFIKYTLTLLPEDFFLFGSGMADDDADMTPVTESCIKWKNGKAKFVDNNVLIPGSSVKGALSHRVAYHYNRLTGIFVDQIDVKEFDKHVGCNNAAVRILFGSEREGEDATRGNVFFSDVIEQKKGDDKTLY